MTKFNKRRRIFYFLTLLYFGVNVFGSCEFQNKPATPGLTKNNNENRLGQTSYYIQLPDNFLILEAKTNEGFLAYSILPKDNSLAMAGTIQVLQGIPTGDLLYDTTNISKDSYISSLLGKKVTWTIKKEENGFFASLDQSQDLSSFVTASNRNQLDSLISIISTLSTK